MRPRRPQDQIATPSAGWPAASSFRPRLRRLPWPPPRRPRASGPAGSFPSAHLHFCWHDVSKSPFSIQRTPDTEAETTGGGGEEGPRREGRRGGPRLAEGTGHLRSGSGTATGMRRGGVGAVVKAPSQVLTWRARGLHREPPRQTARGPRPGAAASRPRWKESTSRPTKPCRQLRSSSRQWPAFTQFLYSAQLRRAASSDSTMSPTWNHEVAGRGGRQCAGAEPGSYPRQRRLRGTRGSGACAGDSDACACAARCHRSRVRASWLPGHVGSTPLGWRLTSDVWRLTTLVLGEAVNYLKPLGPLCPPDRDPVSIRFDSLS